MSYCK